MPPRGVTRRNFLSFDFGHRGIGAADHWIRVHRFAMACRFEVLLSSDDAADVRAARAALDEADAVESAFSVFRDSEVTDLNRRAAYEPVRVRQDVFELLARSADLSRRTEGAFDVTSTPLSRCWGFLRRDGRLPTDVEVAKARSAVGMPYVVLEPESRHVLFAREGVEVNFGAIGKGYALDRMAAVLRREGARHALLSAGRSSVLGMGGRGRGWQVDVRPVLASRKVGRLWIRSGAIGTSGAGEQFIEVEGRRYGHVIDPRSGRPASGVVGASVVTGNAADADALSTAFLIGGPDLARRYCAMHPQTLAILVLDYPGEPTVAFGNYTGATLEMLT